MSTYLHGSGGCCSSSTDAMQLSRMISQSNEPLPALTSKGDRVDNKAPATTTQNIERRFGLQVHFFRKVMPLLKTEQPPTFLNLGHPSVCVSDPCHSKPALNFQNSATVVTLNELPRRRHPRGGNRRSRRA